MSKILVLGSNGQVGSEVGRLLQAQGQQVALATSKTPTQADQVQLNVVTQEGLHSAFNGVDAAFMMFPPGYTNQDELAKPLFAAARQHNLKKVVLMTAMGADADPNAPMRKAEVLLEESGIPYNIIRPNWFMQNFNSFWIHGILQAQEIQLPLGDAKGSFIDARDIAAVATQLLTSDSFNNQALVLTGSEALDHDQVAQLISEATGKKITYNDITPDQMRSNLLQGGVPTHYAEFLLVILGFFKLGYSAAVLPTVEQVLGRPPITLAQYVQDYRGAWV